LVTTSQFPFRALSAIALAAACAFAGLALVSKPAAAEPVAFNGLIAFHRMNTVTTMRPDGSAVRAVATDLSVDPAWTQDGSQLTFIDTPDPSAPGQNLVSAASDGSGLHTLVPNFDGYDLEWSPDGTQFATTGTETGTRKLTVTLGNADGSNLRQPFGGNTSTEAHPSWFPSGDRIVFARDGNIAAANVDGTGLTTLADDPTLTYSSPSLSRNGDRVVFTKVNDQLKHDIEIMNADGTALTRVGPAGLGTDPKFSPDGTQIAFVGERSTGVWVINVDGTGLKQLTTGYADQSPVWQYRSTPLPDVPPPATRFNGKLAFLRSGALYTANADGTGVADRGRTAGPMLSWSSDGAMLAAPVGGNFSTMQPDGSVPIGNFPNVGMHPVLSPDGTKVAYSRNTANQDDIFISNRDGSNEVNILGRPGPDYFPNWSPDGTKIAFQSNQGSGLRVWIMNADGSNPHEVPNQPVGSSGLPKFAPDGTKLLFGNTPVVNGSTSELFLIGVDGTGLTQVGPTNLYINNAVFSPDATKIAFDTAALSGINASVSTPNGVWVMNADGTNAVRVTYGADAWVSWQPLVSAPPNLAPRAFGTAENKKPLWIFGNAATSFDIDGNIVKYEWRWGDYTAMSPYKYVWHKYAKPGTYLVRLTVTDNSGARTTRTAWVKVA
jgi:Tol biopolymer transport system component